MTKMSKKMEKECGPEKIHKPHRISIEIEENTPFLSKNAAELNEDFNKNNNKNSRSVSITPMHNMQVRIISLKIRLNNFNIC